MGFDCVLDEIFSFYYKISLRKSICEHEYDYVFVGKFDGNPLINLKEVENYKWVEINKLLYEIKKIQMLLHIGLS